MILLGRPRRRNSFTLLEVLLSLVLMSALGVTVLRIQAGALRQVRQAHENLEIAQRVEALLESWSQSGTAITLPATGRWNERLAWRREAGPVAVGPSTLATHVLVVIQATDVAGKMSDVYRVDWLVPRPLRRGQR